MSKSGANTVTMKGFATTDRTCQQDPESTNTQTTGTCLGSSKYEFAGDGPGAAFEQFSTSTCDAGTSIGGRTYYKLDTCYSTSNTVCADGKVKMYSYTSGRNCLQGGELMYEVAMGECLPQNGNTHVGLRLESGC